MTTPLIEAIAKAIKDARALPGTNPVARLSDVDRRAAQAALTAITEAGYAVVPVEPTEAMLQGACEKHRPGQPMSATTPHWRGPEWDTDEECPSFVKRRKIYRAMIDASNTGKAE